MRRDRLPGAGLADRVRLQVLEPSNSVVFSAAPDAHDAIARLMGQGPWATVLRESLLIGGWDRLRRVSRDGTISTLFELPEGPANRLGDFAGRYGEALIRSGATRIGGRLPVNPSGGVLCSSLPSPAAPPTIG